MSKLLEPTTGIDLSNNSPLIHELNDIRNIIEHRVTYEDGILTKFADALRSAKGSLEQQVVIESFKQEWGVRVRKLEGMAQTFKTLEDFKDPTYQEVLKCYGNKDEDVPLIASEVMGAEGVNKMQMALKTMIERQEQLQNVQKNAKNVAQVFGQALDNKPSTKSMGTTSSSKTMGVNGNNFLAFSHAQTQFQTPQPNQANFTFTRHLMQLKAKFDVVGNDNASDFGKMEKHFKNTLLEVYKDVVLQQSGSTDLGIRDKCKTITAGIDAVVKKDSVLSKELSNELLKIATEAMPKMKLSESESSISQKVSGNSMNRPK